MVVIFNLKTVFQVGLGFSKKTDVCFEILTYKDLVSFLGLRASGITYKDKGHNT